MAVNSCDTAVYAINLSGLKILMHEIISLPDARSYDGIKTLLFVFLVSK